ncbi:MAG: nitrogen regulation protein NR(II) [Hyphomicrobiaceae bacterium]|nr:nitrogen regulation protein NR(II) [Hyphomicrobiaceae bacterium]
MTDAVRRPAPSSGEGISRSLLNALPHPTIMVDRRNHIVHANDAAEMFFQSSASVLARYPLDHYVPFGSPVLAVLDQARHARSPVTAYRVDVSNPRLGSESIVDVYATPVSDFEGHLAVMFQEQTMAERMERQLTHRTAARSVSSLAAMLAHEIKNPLSGIRGAAQLLETSVEDEDRALTKLITDEADRIVKLVDKMEVFSDERPIEREAVNIHTVLDHVKRLAQSGFARHIRFVDNYDPSLPPVFANRDQLIQVFLNLVKNAAEAIGPAMDGEIVLGTSYKPGVRLSVPGTAERLILPLEFVVRDNGPGVPDDIAAHLFDPFVTTKANGSGLGLALVAKIIGGHGGVVECESQPKRTIFRILMPAYNPIGEEA